jgi:hypothetical protein
MKGFIKLTEYDGYRMRPDKTRINIQDVVNYKTSLSENVTYITIRGEGTIRVGETPEMIDRLIEGSRD